MKSRHGLVLACVVLSVGSLLHAAEGDEAEIDFGAGITAQDVAVDEKRANKLAKRYVKDGFKMPKEALGRPVDEQEAKEDFMIAQAFFEDGMYEDAIERYEACLSNDATNEDVWHELGRALVMLPAPSRAQLRRALHCFHTAAMLRPLSVTAHMNVATTAERLNMHDAAARAYRNVLEIVPMHARASARLGAALLHAARYRRDPRKEAEEGEFAKKPLSLKAREKRLKDAIPLLHKAAESSTTQDGGIKGLELGDQARAVAQLLTAMHYSGLNAIATFDQLVSDGYFMDVAWLDLVAALRAERMYNAAYLVCVQKVKENPAYAPALYEAGSLMAGFTVGEGDGPFAKRVRSLLPEERNHVMWLPEGWLTNAIVYQVRAVNDKRTEDDCQVRPITNWTGEASPLTYSDMAPMGEAPSALVSGEAGIVYSLSGSPNRAGASYGRHGRPRSVVSSRHLEQHFPLDQSWNNELFFHESHVYAAAIPDVTISGSTPLVHTSCDVYVTSHSMYQNVHLQAHGESVGFERGRSVVELETVVSVVQHAQRNYYHWICEQVPKLLYARQLLLDNPEVKIVVAEPAGIQREFVTSMLKKLDLYGHDGERIVWYNSNTTVEAKRAVVVDWRPTGSPSHGREFLPPAQALRMVRDFFVPKWPNKEERNRVIWVSRNEVATSGRRHVINEQAVLSVIRETLPAHLSLEVFRGYEYDQASSVALFSRARAVIGVHGAGLSNIVWCPPGTAVVEITLPERLYRMFAHAAEALDLQYWPLSGLTKPNSFDDEFTLDPEVVEETLTAALDI